MNKISYDIIFVGGGPANLAAAHRLVDIALTKGQPVRMAIFEKGKDFGSHAMSGAVVNPRSIAKLFPDYESNGFPIEAVCTESKMAVLGINKFVELPRFATPPEMKKEGYLILSLADVTRWMADKLVEKTKESTTVIVDLYKGFGASAIVYEGPLTPASGPERSVNGVLQGDKVVGVKVDTTNDEIKDTCYAKLVVFGDKQYLSKDLYAKYNLADSAQAWAVGVKEIWETDRDYAGRVWHTMGYPLLDGEVGGGFVYGLANNRVAIGMVVGLDSPNPNIRPPQLLQEMKKNPFIQQILAGAKIVKYGAALLPEGGWYSLPKQFAVDGAMLVGDALGVLDLKGFSCVDKSMETGMIAAEVISDALVSGDFSAQGLARYKELVLESFVGKELYKSRYYRASMAKSAKVFTEMLPKFVEKFENKGLISAGLGAFLDTSTGVMGEGFNMLMMMNGWSDYGELTFAEDRSHIVPEYKRPSLPDPDCFNKTTLYTTADIVFYATTHYHEGTHHIDETSAAVCSTCINRFEATGAEPPCVGDCTAEVHEVKEKDGAKIHFMNFENCVQCRTCEIVCPERNIRLNPAPGGGGPDFAGM